MHWRLATQTGQPVLSPLALEFERSLVEDFSADDYETFNTILEQLLDKARQLGS